MKRAPNSDPGLFVTDLTVLNKIYQAAKLCLKRPSLTTKMALESTIAEAEQTFSSRQYCSLGGSGDG
jgi:hypothetical protein